MVYTVPHYIAGHTYTETTAPSHDIHNPAFGETIGHVGFASRSTCDKAVAAAKEADDEGRARSQGRS